MCKTFHRSMDVRVLSSAADISLEDNGRYALQSDLSLLYHIVRPFSTDFSLPDRLSSLHHAVRPFPSKPHSQTFLYRLLSTSQTFLYYTTQSDLSLLNPTVRPFSTDFSLPVRLSSLHHAVRPFPSKPHSQTFLYRLLSTSQTFLYYTTQSDLSLLNPTVRPFSTDFSLPVRLSSTTPRSQTFPF